MYSRLQSNDTYTVSFSRDVGPMLSNGEIEVKRVTKTVIKRLYMTLLTSASVTENYVMLTCFQIEYSNATYFSTKKREKIYHSFFKLADIQIFIQMKQTISFFSLQSTRL